MNQIFIRVFNSLSLLFLYLRKRSNLVGFSMYLETMGYRLLFARNGQEAITLALSQQPDVILIDIQPKMDGLEVIQQIRQQKNANQLPIIALTALAMKSDQERCLEAGANEYLSKPVKLKELDALIKKMITPLRKLL